MALPSPMPDMRHSVLVVENETSKDLAVRPSLVKPFAFLQSMIRMPLAAEFAVIRDRPALGMVVMMPLAAFMFVGLFLGELIGAVLGIYFAGLNVIFLRGGSSSARPASSARGPCLDLIPEQS